MKRLLTLIVVGASLVAPSTATADVTRAVAHDKLIRYIKSNYPNMYNVRASCPSRSNPGWYCNWAAERGTGLVQHFCGGARVNVTVYYFSLRQCSAT